MSTSLLDLIIIYTFKTFMESSNARKDNQVKTYQLESSLNLQFLMRFHLELILYIYTYNLNK